jgi:transcriptional regulator with XRE-family HTH domain
LHLSSSILDFMLDEFSRRVKELRVARQWSLDDLARASGVSRSMISQIERGEANPTLAVTLRMAQGFGLSLSELVEAPGRASSIAVIRADDRAHDYRRDDEVQIRTLSPLEMEKDVELYEVRLRVGGALRSAAHFAGTREFLQVEAGRVRVESGSDLETLSKGDSASYRADVPHAIVNVGKTAATVMLVVVYR